ncbi:hypothetical protein ACU5P1_10220 [Pseudomonas plecoglossicida]|uniref:hypothetical protein n=1 Tax=Pseudomonas plecoglossicida TaxID=70775 RepID=UPI0003A5DC2A|nr:hypothetical protein [Pseudomonas plecoglossicida]GLR35195.1 hypothetical protein GCM10011247_05920 [Pseudomonas plecoglossicida]
MRITLEKLYYTATGSAARAAVRTERCTNSRGDRTLKPDADGNYTLELSAKGDESNLNYLPHSGKGRVHRDAPVRP